MATTLKLIGKLATQEFVNEQVELMVDQDELNAAVDEALAEAKTSGEFDGPQGEKGETGENGATFTPSVSADGNLSWTNDKGLTNPATVNIKGEKGDAGEKGADGAQGIQGEKGDKGDKGDTGAQGEKGDKGDTGAAGADGKTAYQYAQDGGYTGTEEEFAAKLAAENGVVSWNDLEDKPVTVIGGDTLTWDGNTEGLINVDDWMYHVSDAVPADSDISENATISGAMFGNSSIATMNPSEIAEGYSGDATLLVANDVVFGIIIRAANDTIDGAVFPKTGVYFMDVAAGCAITIPGYTGFTREKIAPTHLYQPDWNQNDATKPDYVKNRSYYVENLELVNGSYQMEYFEPEGMFAVEIEVATNEALSHATDIEVIWDGAKYNHKPTCVVGNTYEDKKLYGFGNAILTTGIDDGVPFFVNIQDNAIFVVDLYATEAVSHHIKITAKIPHINEDEYPSDVYQVWYNSVDGYLYRTKYDHTDTNRVDAREFAEKFVQKEKIVVLDGQTAYTPIWINITNISDEGVKVLLMDADNDGNVVAKFAYTAPMFSEVTA